MDIDAHYERTERYLRGEMSAEERAAFEAALQSNSDLQKHVRMHRLADAALEQELEVDIRGRVEALRTQQDLKGLSFWRGPLAWAAGFLLLAVLGFLFLRDKNTGSGSARMAMEYYQPAASPALMGDAAPGSGDFLEGLNAYFKEQNYSKALAIFAARPGDPAAHYYRGHALFQLKRYAEAVEQWQEVQAFNRLPPFIPFGELDWNIALARYAQNPADQQALEVIAGEDGHPFQERARALLQEVR